MTLHQFLGTLLFSALLAAPTVAAASPNDIDIQLDGLRVQVSDNGGITINSRTLGLNTNPAPLRESIYQRFDFDRYQPGLTCRSSSNRSTNTYTHRSSSSSTYTQNSITTRICQ